MNLHEKDKACLHTKAPAHPPTEYDELKQLFIDLLGAFIYICNTEGHLSLVLRVLIMNSCVTTFKQAGLSSFS